MNPKEHLPEILSTFEELSRRKDAGPLTAEESEQFKVLVTLILSQAELTLISPDAKDADIHRQLVSGEKKDKVHPLTTDEELSTKRLGNENASKRSYALVVPGENGQRIVLAVVYTYWSNGTALPGKANEILAEPSRPLTQPADTVTFYSISSFLPKAGEALIKKIHAALRNTAITMTTLSPLRSLAAWKKQKPATDAELKAEALRYLLENQDSVQKFHLGNGAYIGDIKLNANTADSADGKQGLGVMVNYVYSKDPEQLARHQALYKQGKIVMATSLYESLDTESKSKAAPLEAVKTRASTPKPPGF